jgi:hypothetical protein
MIAYQPARKGHLTRKGHPKRSAGKKRPQKRSQKKDYLSGVEPHQLKMAPRIKEMERGDG